VIPFWVVPDANRPTRRFGTGGAIVSLRRSERRVYDAPRLDTIPVLLVSSRTESTTANRMRPVGRSAAGQMVTVERRTGMLG
jgi:hypothetical protein